MDDFIKKTGQTPPPPVPPVPPGPTPEDQKELATQLEAAFKAIGLGVEIGKTKDFATERAGLIFGSLINSITSLLTGSLPSTRLSETKIKVEVGFDYDQQAVHQKAINGFKKRIVAPAKALYNNNFKYYIDSVEGNEAILHDITKRQIKSDSAVRANNIASEIMSLNLHSAKDTVEIWSSSGPYKIVLDEAIPRLREKFSAITTFSMSNGMAIAGRIRAGSETPADLDFLKSLFIAIYEWFIYIDAFGGISASSQKSEGGGDDSDRDCPESVAEIINGTLIRAIEPGDGMRFAGPGEIVVDRSGGTVRASLKLVLVTDPSAGGDVTKVNDCHDNIDYVKHYIAAGVIDVSRSTAWPHDITDAIKSVSTNASSYASGAAVELIIHFEYSFITGLSSGDHIFHIDTGSSSMDILANDNLLQDQLTKLSSETTTSLYETVSPDGERVFFTPTDLVVGGGKVRGSKGRYFKPKKLKGKSLADRVNSKGFGKIRDRGDK